MKYPLLLVASSVVLAVEAAPSAQGIRTPPAKAIEPSGFEVVPLGLASRVVVSEGGDDAAVWLLVDEEDQGETDLNGDGDTGECVLHWYDVEASVTTNVGITVDSSGFGCSGAAVFGSRIAFPVNELLEGAMDLNGDGDIEYQDAVAHWYDRSTGVTTNLGITTSGVAWAADRLLVLVTEWDQEMDLNGDVARNDIVPHLHFPDHDITFNVGFQAGHASMVGDLLVFETSENGNGGTDLNGDGDTSDVVLSVHDLSNQVSTFLGGVELEFVSRWTLSDDLLVYPLWELAEGEDLNGDGDTDDHVWHVYDAATTTATNLGLAARDYGGRPVIVADYAAFPVLEVDVDLNGDGDLSDYIAHVYDKSDQSVTSLGLEFSFHASLVHADDEWLAFTLSEAAYGDLNGDPDLEDQVVHSLRWSQPSVVTNHGLAGNVRAAGRGLIAVNVEEQEHFNMSLNGDTDTLDSVPHVIELDTGEITNLGTAGFVVEVSDRWFAWGVDEADDAGTDHNGDGDTDDLVLFAGQLASRPFNTGVAIDYIEGLTGPSTFAFQVSEEEQGNTDLNGDGDTDDSVAHVIRRIGPGTN